MTDIDEVRKNIGSALEDALDEWAWQETISNANIPENLKHLEEKDRRSLLDSRLIIHLSNILVAWRELKGVAKNAS